MIIENGKTFYHLLCLKRAKPFVHSRSFASFRIKSRKFARIAVKAAPFVLYFVCPILFHKIKYKLKRTNSECSSSQHPSISVSAFRRKSNAEMAASTASTMRFKKTHTPFQLNLHTAYTQKHFHLSFSLSCT